MATIGYALACEEHSPIDLVAYGERAEQAGFEFTLISDHFHPWLDVQGNSPFVWSVLGALAQRTDRMLLGTGVTCPTTRIHPAIVAHAAATTAALLPGRLWLGVGTGENLNEHILGDHWPPTSVRRERLAEAVEVIRALWSGRQVEHHGRHYTVENARLYTLPDEPPPILVAGAGPKAAETVREEDVTGPLPCGPALEPRASSRSPSASCCHGCGIWRRTVRPSPVGGIAVDVERHVVTLAVIDPAGVDGHLSELARALDGKVGSPDDNGMLDVELSADSREQALERVRDAIAAAGADDHLTFTQTTGTDFVPEGRRADAPDDD